MYKSFNKQKYIIINILFKYMSKLNDEEVYSIRLITQILSAISIVGLLFVFFLFWFFKSIRSFALELVIWLSFSCILFNISYFFPIGPESDGWCVAQAIISGTFDLSGMMWTTIIGYTAYISLYKPDHLDNHKNKYRILFFVLADVIPLAVASM
jgi:hypothetical protein